MTVTDKKKLKRHINQTRCGDIVCGYGLRLEQTIYRDTILR
jgi:hypothetical protein